MRSRMILTFFGVLACAASGFAEDWPFFRGPARDGKSAEAKAPLEWSKSKNILWKVKLPRQGNSSPVVTGDKVLVTCAEDSGGNKRSLYCFDKNSGKQLWVKTVQYDQKEPTHATNQYCASTPATDGKMVVVWHGSAGLYGYDLEGKELWKNDTGSFRHIWGYAGSRLIVGETAYINCGPGARSFVLAVNKADGTQIWKHDEPRAADDKSPETKGWVGSWSSPIVAKIGGQDELLIFQSGQVNGYDLKTGKVLWSADGAGDLAYTDVMIAAEAGVGIAMAGYGGAAVGFKLGQGPADAPTRLWRNANGNPQRIGSGVVVGNHVYTVGEPAIQCFDVMTGKATWMQKWPGQSFWASIVGAADRLYATSQKGTTFVFAPDPKEFKLLATNDLGEHVNASPAISGGRIYIRTWENLYCIGE